MHVSLPGTGVLWLPFALAASASALIMGSAPANGPHEDAADAAAMVEMDVVGVAPMDDDESSVLVLREKNGQSVLPIFIGRPEGNAIQLGLHHDKSIRPLTQDLLGNAIRELGGRVVRVEIDGVQEAVFRAHILVAQGDRSLDLDARPSDSVALALRAEAPIFASRRVIAISGLAPADLERMRRPNHHGHGSRGPAGSVSL